MQQNRRSSRLWVMSDYGMWHYGRFSALTLWIPQTTHYMQTGYSQYHQKSGHLQKKKPLWAHQDAATAKVSFTNGLGFFFVFLFTGKEIQHWHESMHFHQLYKGIWEIPNIIVKEFKSLCLVVFYIYFLYVIFWPLVQFQLEQNRRITFLVIVNIQTTPQSKC